MKEEVFFINIYPTNDRRADLDHRQMLSKVSEDAKKYGFAHTLLTVGDKRIDPWVMAQAGCQKESSFSPLIALNPFYTHPVEVAKRVISLHKMFGSQISLNLVAGSFFNELKALGDELTNEERSKRLKDYYKVLSAVLMGTPAYISSQYYPIEGAEIYPKYSGPAVKYFVSGGLAEDFKDEPNAYFVKNIRPMNEQAPATCKNSGLALGVCARPTKEEAIEAVKRIYPEDRRGEMIFQMSLANKETPWNQWLTENLTKHEGNYSYYLGPMKNFWSAAPFVVDTYENVAKTIDEYRKLGYQFFILDFNPDEAPHVGKVLESFRKITS